MSSWKIAFIGLGQISAAHLRGLRRWNEEGGGDTLDLAAVAEPMPGRGEAWVAEHFAGAERRPAVLSDYRLLLEPAHRPDLVSILVPHHLHLEIARPFLEAGIAVQMQKPLGLGVRDARELAELAQRHRAPLVVSEPSVLGRARRREIAWIASGAELGEPTLLIDQAVLDLHGGYFMTPWRHLKGMAGAGWFIDHGVHRTHWMREALGPCRSAFAHARQIEPRRADARWGSLEVDTEDLVSALLRFESGAVAQFTVMSGGRGRNHGHVELYGTRGSWNGRFTPSGGAEQELPLAPANGIPEDGFAHSYMELLARRSQWDAPVIGSPEGALEAEAMIYACLESAHTGSEVRVADVLDGTAHAYEDTVWEARARLPQLSWDRLT